MTTIVRIDPEMMEFEHSDGLEPNRIKLVLAESDGQLHSLTLEGRAINDLATIFRAIQTALPGALGDR